MSTSGHACNIRRRPAPGDEAVRAAAALIAAAAEWGKSTLLADWAIAAPGRVAWLSLDATDDEPWRFLSY
jgi:LuxR family transcriptional regulator, maltose regulon positive regulatory protein